MDWSLVLASQGIEHVIDKNEATGWTLAVSSADHDKSLAVIELYRRENRHWRWRQPVFQPGLFFDWRSLVWVLLTIFFYVWSESNTNLRNIGMMDRAALTEGDWWRLFTATWLHADIGIWRPMLFSDFFFWAWLWAVTPRVWDCSPPTSPARAATS